MEENISKMMLPFKLQQLLDTIIEKKGLAVEDALHYLYTSNLYAQLSSESSYLWQLSTLNLYNLLKEEKRLKRRAQHNSPAISLFLVFCIENYKEHKRISVEETLFTFITYNVSGFLQEVYDTLHTQSKEYIMTEIDSYITNRKKANK